MAFFRKADAKVRLFFEPPKLFEVFFEKFLFQSGSSSLRPFVQYFNSSAFLSRKRMQNYCFTTYLPNISSHFFATFCKLFANSLICREVLQQGFSAAFQGRFILHLNFITRTRIRIYIWHASRTLHPVHPSMEGTVSSFTSEHLQQSLQHCNESISYKESTDYGGKSSATGNTHLPQHRDRCGRWVSAHPPQERTDFQVYGLPLQMCMWFWMTRQSHRITCLDELPNASREILQRAKAHSWIRQGVFIKTSRTFSKSSSSFWKSPCMPQISILFQWIILPVPNFSRATTGNRNK